MTSDRRTLRCVECGKDLTDPKNRGDPDANGEWVCFEASCRAVHDAEVPTPRGIGRTVPREEQS